MSLDLDKEIEGFQRDLEVMDMEYRKRVANSPLARWMDKRRRKRNGRKNRR